MKLKVGIERETRRIFYVSVFSKNNYENNSRKDIDLEPITRLSHFNTNVSLEIIPLKIEK